MKTNHTPEQHQALTDLEAIASLIWARQRAGCEIRPNDWLELNHQCIAAQAAIANGETKPGDNESDYWLLRSLAQYVSDLNIACEREPVSCDQSSLCITEWCEPCAVKAWLANQRR